jgi:hypothetical protein
MNWRYINASIIGTSHKNSGMQCQDECLSAEIEKSDGSSKAFIAIASDGAGSARYGREGAITVCEYIYETVQKWFNDSAIVQMESQDKVKEWIIQVRDHLDKIAKKDSLTIRDYACTLLCTVITPEGAIYFQIGDGAIVISEGGEYRPVFWPQSGEYINMTNFITDFDASEYMQIEISPTVPLEVALLSDGLQHLALHFETKTAYSPFFEPMFSHLRKEPPGFSENLTNQLALFLQSKVINERTDDDKTLVLGTQLSTSSESAGDIISS